jgi:hypothetical protein
MRIKNLDRVCHKKWLKMCCRRTVWYKPHLYIYSNGTDVLSFNRLLLKNEILYILSSGSVISEIHPPFLLRFIFLSVWTITTSGSLFNIIFYDVKIHHLYRVII